MIEEGSFVIFPAYSEAFSIGFSSSLLVDCGKIIAIWCWFFFGIAEDDIRDGSALSTSKGATFPRDGVWNLRLDNIGIVWRAIFESAIL